MKITPYLMPMRCDAQVFLKHLADMEILSRYIRRQKQEKDQKLSYMQIIVAAYVRAVSRNPEVNRFIVNKQLFARNNCSAAFTILKNPADADDGEAVVKIKFDLTDTLYDVRDRMEAAVRANRGDQPKNFLDKLAAFIFKVPGLPTALVAVVKLLDRYGICPKFLIDELPFHASMFITNTASIGLHDVNHHIYNFGDVSMFLGMGLPERVTVMEKGEPKAKRYLPIGVTVDERICSGAHYARFFSDFRRAIEHPELLLDPPEEVRYDHGVEFHQPKPARKAEAQ